jgi:hypothetical protein
MQPWASAYKLWLGDVVEFVQVAWGSGSPELVRIADLLRGTRPEPDDGQYLQRLRQLDDLLAEFERELAQG